MPSPPTEPRLFSPLPQWKMPWSEFFLSYGTQAVVIAILVWIPVLHPEILESPKKDYHAIELVPTPVPVNHTPQRQLPKPVVVAELDPPPAALRLPAPQPQPKPRVEETPAPEVKIAAKKLDLPPSTAPRRFPSKSCINNFSTGSSAPQTIERAPEKVQTGGFGDPNGVPAKTTQTRAVNIAQAGGFDMPTGPGYGNGTGGPRVLGASWPARGSAMAWPPETCRLPREAWFARQDSATPTFAAPPDRAIACRCASGRENCAGGNPFQAGSHLH